MNTKIDFAGGPQKAKEAYELYQEFQPDGVIAADDNAQMMFVVPYLKDKVKTPVMFCGVNAEPEKYGYPTSHISGILERFHIRETIAFARQLIPSVKKVGYIEKKSTTADAVVKQMQDESESYGVEFRFKLPEDMKEAVNMTRELRSECDALFIATLEGLPKEEGGFISEQEGIPIIAEIFGKPTITNIESRVKAGILCAVIQKGQEQGETAAKMLLKAMQGTPVSDIPITRNRNGKPIINLTVMKALNIKPSRMLLMGADLVRTEK